MKPPRIVLLHATPVAVEPVEAAFRTGWPEAETVNLLDDSLSRDRAREDDLSEAMIERFVAFGRHAHRIGADGVLVTCSAFGPAIERLAAALPVPVLKPNEAMFRAAIGAADGRPRRIGMLATFAPSIPTMTEEFEAFVAETGARATLDTVLTPDAIDRLKAGDAPAHNRLVAADAPAFAGHDAVMLAHFSTSRAAEAVRAMIACPVLTAPDSAVALMKARVMG